MNNRINSILAKAAGAISLIAGTIALGACSNDAIEPLSGKYAKPEVHTLNKVLSTKVEKGTSTRTFSIEFASEGVSGSESNYSGTGAVLSMQFVANNYFLPAAAYTPAAASSARNGNYITGEGASAFYTVSGGSAQAVPVNSGALTVAVNGSDYTLKGFLWLADESVIEVNAAVTMVFEPDQEGPTYTELTKLISAQSNAANGVQSLTFNFASEGVEATYDPSTWSTVYSGSGNYLALDIYSADGALHTGTYSASAVGGTIGEGEFGIGYDTEMWGMSFTDWGTCWWTVDNGATSAEKVLDGTVTVSIESGNTVVTLESSAANARFTYSGTSLPDNMGGSISVVE